MTPLPAHDTEAPDLLTVPEVAELTRVSDETVHRWCRLGQLPYVSLPSGLKRIRRADVQAFLAEPGGGAR